MNHPPSSHRTAAADWTTQRERSNVAILRLMVWLSLRCGRTASRAILRGISVYFLLFAPAARRASRGYLRRVLPHPPRWADLYRHIFTFASTIHDRVFLLKNRYELFDLEVHGEDIIRDVIKNNSGVILLGAHFGSFEIIRALGEHQPNLRIAMAMFEDNARKIRATMTAINPALVNDIIALGHVDTMLQIQQRLEQGALVGLLADRSPHREALLEVAFLGAPAQFPLGPMRLAAVLRKPVVFMSGEYLGGNRYAIHFERLADFSAVQREGRQAATIDAIHAYARCLENHCRRQPYNWFNFFDFWRTMPPAGPQINSET
jgi:predicted LPLAT superfamily acyltransferase